jgi:nifR3 family TIM-barrel protein
MIFRPEERSGAGAPVAAAPAMRPAGPRGLPNGARVILAPLCGITTAPFRRICLDHGAELAVTEMVSSEAITRGKEEDCRAVRGLDPAAGPLSVQIFGADPVRMGETAARLAEREPVYLDMNFGCPVKKIVTRNGGSAVLRDLGLLSRICREVVARSEVPVSAKIRAGWDRPTGENVREIARTIEGAGVTMLAIHARTKKQGFSGEANWELIAEAKRAVSIPVIGNGDVRTADDVFAMHEVTGCDAVMIGRGAIGNPWIFEEVRARLDGRDYTPPGARTRVEVLLAHVRESVALDGEPGGLIATRKVTAAYVKFLPNARELRGRLMQVATLGELEDVLAAYLEDNGL